LEVACQRISSIGGIEYDELPCALGEPCPARAKVANGLRREFCEEIIEASPFLNYLVFKLASGFSFIGGYAVPVEGMVPVLGCVVEYLGVFTAS
jgi:hypothetical protein